MAIYCQAIWGTELGKALAKRLPPETRRIVRDIAYDDAVKVYYECYATEGLLNFDWDSFLTGADIIAPKK